MICGKNFVTINTLVVGLLALLLRDKQAATNKL